MRASLLAFGVSIAPVAERPGLAETWQRVIEANLRYYEGLIRLSSDYLGAVIGTLGEIRPAWPGRPVVMDERRHVAADTSGVHTHTPAPALVLEAEAGRDAMGAFLVENHLNHRVVAPIVTSVFRDPAGREVHPKLSFEPDSIALEPGEQILVRVGVSLDETTEPGVGYRGEVSIPGLSNSRIQLVIRRRQPSSPSISRRDRKLRPAARGRAPQSRSSSRRR